MTKQKSTKRALLLSALSLLMCVSMLIGSTFAWFTDSVTSAGNKIQAGTLKIDLELLEKNEDGSTKWTSLKDSKAPIFNYDKWEPGYTDVKILKVENEGTLALKWVAKFVSANDLTELANVIDVYVKPSADEFGYATDRTDLSTWTKKGTVAEFVNTISETTYGNLEAGKAAYLGIALKMQESADNKYQGMDLGGAFDIMILATQYTSESDSFNNQYDANAKYDVDIWDGKTETAPVVDADGVYHITSAANLVGMMNVTGNSIYNGKTIVLDNNIDLGGRTVKGIGGIKDNFAGVFDGQGYTISNFKVDSTENSYYAGLFNQVSHGGTIKNLTVKNATIVGKSMVGAIASSVDSGATIDNCKAIDCTLIGVKKVGAVVGYSAGSTVTNNYAENCSVYYSEKDGGEILGYEYTGSTVSNNTFKNVSVKQGVAVSSADDMYAALDAGEKDLVVVGATIDENNFNGHYYKDRNIDFVDCTFTANMNYMYINDATFTNCTFDCGETNSAVHYDELFGDLVFNNCTFKSGKIQIGANKDVTGTVAFNDCVFAKTTSTSIWSEAGIRVYSPAEFKGCEFNNRVVLAGSNGLSITFESCTMNNGTSVYYVDNTDGIIRGGNVPVVTIK